TWRIEAVTQDRLCVKENRGGDCRAAMCGAGLSYVPFLGGLDCQESMYMNKRERLQATIAGEPVDRVAVALWRHFPVDDQDPEAFATATLEFQHQYDWDLVKVTPSSSFCLSDWGVIDAWRGDP